MKRTTQTMYNYNGNYPEKRMKQQHSSYTAGIGDMSTSVPPPGYHGNSQMHGSPQYSNPWTATPPNFQNYTPRPSLLNTHPNYRSSMASPAMKLNPEGDRPSVSPDYHIPHDGGGAESMSLRSEGFACLQKNAISALMEFGQARHLASGVDIQPRGGTEEQPIFTAAAYLGKRIFPIVEGRNKQECRKRAAEKALRILNAEENMATSNTFRPARRSYQLPAHENRPPPQVPQVAKDPVSAFMEYGQSMQLPATIKLVGQSGQPHLPNCPPRFIMAAVLGERQFEPQESSQKKHGKKLAAIKALETLKAEGAYSKCPPLVSVPNRASSVEPLAEDTPKTSGTSGKNPVSMLYEIAQSNKQTARIDVLGQTGQPHKPEFEIAAYLGDRMFEKVTAGNKKEGRILAAQKALKTLESEGQTPLLKASAQTSKQNQSKPVECKTHFDKIASLSHAKFDSLVAGVQANLSGRKIIAAIVMMSEANKTGTVVSVGSGNRCIVGDQMSLHGTVVNDSHAEVIAKRSFQRFLNKQLLLFSQKSSDCILVLGRSQMLRVRPDITFHMYISTAPCGDGAIFSHSEPGLKEIKTEDDEHRPNFTNGKTQGQLRTKLEKGEGTIPIESDFQTQTWDGIRRGDRLRTMSCSDKICRWNILGLQGSLLTNLIEPVYLSSITLGQLYSHGHLSRALCCRLMKACPTINTSLPDKYKLVHPKLGQVTAWDPPRETEKSGSLSVNWCLGDDCVEVVDGTYGLCHDSPGKRTQSRLSKANLFVEFKESCLKAAYGKRNMFLNCSYHEAKQQAQSYQKVKALLYQVVKEYGLGTWVTKPIEGQQFM